MSELEQKAKKIKGILQSNPINTIDGTCFIFRDGDIYPRDTAGLGILGFLQDWFKKHSRIYYVIIHLFSPAIPSLRFLRALRLSVRKYSSRDDVVLNLCSGPKKLFNRNDIVNIDMFAFKNVDICAYASSLPLKDNSVDMVYLMSSLEHISEYSKVVDEMHRTLKKGGQFMVEVPFIYPFHAAPSDYVRLTSNGCRELFSSFDELDVFSGYGPTCGLLAVFQEYVASSLSFGSKTTHDLLFIIMLLVTWPIKFLDWILEYNHLACQNSGGFVIMGKK